MKSVKVCEYSRSWSFHDDLILQDQASGERSQDQWSSGLKHGVILAFLKLSGNIPVVILRFRIFATGTAITDELNLKNLALRSSSPVALEGLRASSCFCTKVMETGGISNFSSGGSLLWTKLFKFSEMQELSVFPLPYC